MWNNSPVLTWRGEIWRIRATNSVHKTDSLVESSWNVMAHGDAGEGKWRGNWRMEWVASTLHTSSEHGVSRITTADAHTSTASSGWTDAPADLNGLVRFAERRNLASARVPSHFKRSLLLIGPRPPYILLLAVLYSIEPRVFLGGPYNRQANSKHVEVSYSIRTHRGLQRQFWAVIALVVIIWPCLSYDVCCKLFFVDNMLAKYKYPRCHELFPAIVGSWTSKAWWLRIPE